MGRGPGGGGGGGALGKEAREDVGGAAGDVHARALRRVRLVRSEGRGVSD